MKKWTYVIGIIALGFVIFNNVVQTESVIQSNTNLIIGLIIAMIGSIVYGIINIKK